MIRRTAPPAAARAWRAAALCAGLALAACAPADDPHKLLADLANPDAEARQEATDKLEAIVARNDASVFVRGLDSPNMLVRAQSITYLARIQTPEARAALRGLLAGDRRMMLPYNPIRLRPESTTTSDSRILVANLIQRTGPDPKAIEVLLEGAEEGRTIDELVGTCLAVGALRDPAGLAFLDRAALHPEPEVARSAAQAMAQFSGPEALASLGRLATSRHDEVLADVIVALAPHPEPEARDILMRIGAQDARNDVKSAAYEALSRHPSEAVVPYFIERLRAADDETRATLVEILGRQTGQNLGAKPEAWARYWASKQGSTAAAPPATR